MASVRAVILFQGKILFLQRSAQVSRPGQWCLPGGRIEEGESPEAAILRETLEEAGLEIEIQMPLKQVESCTYFLCRLKDPLAVVELALDECQDFLWIRPQHIRQVGYLMDYRTILPLLRSLKSRQS